MTHDLIAAYWHIGAGFVAGCTFTWFCGIWYGRRVLLDAARRQALWEQGAGQRAATRAEIAADPEVDRRLRELIAEQPRFRRVRRA